MRTLLGAVLVLGWSAVATAAPRSVLVLPLDGNVDAGTRGKLNAEVVTLARTLPGAVNVGDTTFEETAAAVGCEAAAPMCAETVRSTLGVDELVYGRASTDGSQTTLVVHRIRDKTAAREATATLAPTDDPVSARTTLAPLFDAAAPPPVPPPVPAEDPVQPPAETAAHPGRTRGILVTASGGAVLVVGIGLWISTRGDQSDIDNATPSTTDDFRALKNKEDRVQRNAIIGDVLVGVGAGLATWGIITLVQSRRASDSVVVAPSVSTSAAGVVLGGTW